MPPCYCYEVTKKYNFFSQNLSPLTLNFVRIDYLKPGKQTRRERSQIFHNDNGMLFFLLFTLWRGGGGGEGEGKGAGMCVE